MQNHTAIIIQARTASTRLPKKILLPFYKDKCCIELLIERISSTIDLPVLIATSTNKQDDEIALLAKKMKVDCFRGDENNVLKRFIDCAKHFNVKNIIRICSDNPFLDIDDLEMLSSMPMDGYDYISFCVNDTPSIKTHYGLWAEKVSTDALQKVLKLTTDKLYLEHVTNFIYVNEKIFKYNLINRTKDVPSFPVRLTLDTKEDFEVLTKIYSVVVENKLSFNKESIFKIISQDQNYQDSMKLQIIKNSK